MALIVGTVSSVLQPSRRTCDRFYLRCQHDELKISFLSQRCNYEWEWRLRHIGAHWQFHRFLTFHFTRTQIHWIPNSLSGILPLFRIYRLEALHGPEKRCTCVQCPHNLHPLRLPQTQTDCVILVSGLHRVLARHSLFTTTRTSPQIRRCVWDLPACAIRSLCILAACLPIRPSRFLQCAARSERSVPQRVLGRYPQQPHLRQTSSQPSDLVRYH